MRNTSTKKMQMHQTLNNFKMEQGSVESDKTNVMSAVSQRERNVKLQPLTKKNTPKIDSNTQVAMD